MTYYSKSTCQRLQSAVLLYVFCTLLVILQGLNLQFQIQCRVKKCEYLKTIMQREESQELGLGKPSTYLYYIRVLSSGYDSYTSRFQHQILHEWNNLVNIALILYFFSHSYAPSIQYRKYIVHPGKFHDLNTFYHSSLLKIEQMHLVIFYVLGR